MPQARKPVLCVLHKLVLSICSLWHAICRRPLVVPSDMFDVGLGHSKAAWGAEAFFLFLMQSWEFGIPLCRELACQYESLYDYQSLSWIRVSFAPSPAPTLSGGASTFLASTSKGAFTVDPALGLVLWTVQEKQKPRFLLSRCLHYGWGTKTNTWQMIVWSRPQGPLVLKEGRSSIHRIGWGFQGGGGSSTSWRSFSWNDFVQVCFIWKHYKIFHCLGLWSILSTQVKEVLLPFFDEKYSKLSEMDFDSLPNFS